MRVNDLAAVVRDGERAAVIKHALQDEEYFRRCGVELLQHEDLSLPHRDGEDAVLKVHFPAPRLVLADEVGHAGLAVEVYPAERPVETGRELSDEGGLAGAGRADEEDAVVLHERGQHSLCHLLVERELVVHAGHMIPRDSVACSLDAEELPHHLDGAVGDVNAIGLEVFAELGREQRRVGAALLIRFRREIVVVTDVLEQADRLRLAADAAEDSGGVHKNILSLLWLMKLFRRMGIFSHFPQTCMMP